MKDLLFIVAIYFFSVSNMIAQEECEELEPLLLPYYETLDDFTNFPYLPYCMKTEDQNMTHVFSTSAGPVAGFQGNVFAFDSSQFEWSGIPDFFGLMATLDTHYIELVQGVGYTVSFRYGNSNAQKTISMLAVELDDTSINIGEVSNITGAAAANYVSAQFTPPVTGIYKVRFRVYTPSEQGLLYLDDIRVEETGIMKVVDNTLAGLKLYPNPAKNVLMLEYREAIDSVEVYNSTGQLLLFDNPKSIKAAVSLGNLPAGIYSVHIESANKKKICRLIKE